MDSSSLQSYAQVDIMWMRFVGRSSVSRVLLSATFSSARRSIDWSSTPPFLRPPQLYGTEIQKSLHYPLPTSTPYLNRFLCSPVCRVCLAVLDNIKYILRGEYVCKQPLGCWWCLKHWHPGLSSSAARNAALSTNRFDHTIQLTTQSSNSPFAVDSSHRRGKDCHHQVASTSCHRTFWSG